MRALGELPFVFVMAPQHALASGDGPLSSEALLAQRAVAVADSARDLEPLTVGLLPGQDVLTVPSMRLKIDAILRGLGCGWLPEPMARPWLNSGALLARPVSGRHHSAHVGFAWRRETAQSGRAQSWWLEQLAQDGVRRRLLAV